LEGVRQPEEVSDDALFAFGLAALIDGLKLRLQQI
jgi:hypothetical protein